MKKREDSRNIKKCNKYIERQEFILKNKLIESDGMNKDILEYMFKIDVCDGIDYESIYMNIRWRRIKNGMKLIVSFV